MYHNNDFDYMFAPEGIPRAHIEPKKIKQLWFHTGTHCNLACSFCYEGSKPGDNRIESLTFYEARPYIENAGEMKMEEIWFTGGEPFVNAEFLKILSFALDKKPCFVLTNGIGPIKEKMQNIIAFTKKAHPLHVGVSLDFPDPDQHDHFRGPGHFQAALETLRDLFKAGLSVFVVRQEMPYEEEANVCLSYAKVFKTVGLPKDIPLVVFPDFYPPESEVDVPSLTDRHVDELGADHSSHFLCAMSRMVLKKEGRMCVYACPFVDDDSDYDMGSSLREAMASTVKLKHHRCYSCYNGGTTLNELKKHVVGSTV